MTIKNNKLNKIIKIATAIITIVAIIFVSERIITNQIWNLNLIKTGTIINIVFIGGGVYFANQTLLPVIWRKLLIWFGEIPGSYLEIYVLYGISQIMKYIPGNVFHFATRHVMSLQNGSKNAPLLAATFFELLNHALGAATICFIGYFFYMGYLQLSFTILILIILLVSLSLLIAIIIIPKIIKNNSSVLNLWSNLQRNHKNKKDAFVSIGPIFGLILLFFIISGLIFYFLIIWVTSNPVVIPISLALSIYSIAYLLGLITPGASAGVGVRESAIILLLSGYTDNSQATLIALLSRLITVVGDLFFYLFSLALRKLKKL